MKKDWLRSIEHADKMLVSLRQQRRHFLSTRTVSAKNGWAKAVIAANVRLADLDKRITIWENRRNRWQAQADVITE